MNDIDIKRIELEVNSLIQQKSTYTSITAILIGSTISLILTTINVFKIILILLGFCFAILFLASIENCSQQIKTKIKELK